ncbi:hypothetical protein [Taibaiella koreensis]|uniref:hypothetical protein n=1 Tax=Taibaiella koreensis TaxID=1268548 RepID=UPI000E59BADA|nr:hypothetical protein [Taibaiella koreensis]
MKLPPKAGHRFLAQGEKLYLQPNRVYRFKVAGCILLALAGFGVALTKIVSYDMQVLCQVLSIIVLAYAVFDTLFRVNLTYIFDGGQQQVYRKFPGLFTQKLMPFNEVCILPETEHGSLRYSLSRKRNKFGKSFPLSDFFSGSKKGEKRQLQFEEEILATIVTFVEARSTSTPNLSL